MRGSPSVGQGLRAAAGASDLRRGPARLSVGGMNAGLPAPPGVRITHGERVIDPSSGLTKQVLADYYAAVAPAMLPHLRDRPVAVLRAPDGVDGERFFQKHVGAVPMPGIRELDPRLDPGHAPLMVIDDAEALVGAAQMNAVEFHTWNATTSAIEQPDRMTFDLDPGEGVRWPQVAEAAKLTRALLEALGLQSFLKTSGGKGLHVVVPLSPRDDWATVRAFSKAVVEHLARTVPQRFVSKSGPRNRVGRVFADYLRNGRGATTAAALSARARPGLGVSVPLRWQDLPRIDRGDAWTVASLPRPVPADEGPWQGYAAVRESQTLADAMRELGFSSAA